MFTKSYSIEVKTWTGNYSHKFKLTCAQEYLCWDGVPVRKTNEHIGNSWDPTNSNMYGPIIVNSMRLCLLNV